MVISAIGTKAGVVVNKADGKFASAHDLRKSLATRWAARVKLDKLQQMMRHADHGTTMKYYVAQNAADVGDELWTNYPPTSNTFGNTGPVIAENAEAKGSQISRETRY
jgi:integrase